MPARIVYAGVALGVALCAPAGAQAPAGSYTLSAAAVAESLKVLDQLGRLSKTDKKDAAAWHRRGMIAFALAERTHEKPAPGGLDYRKLRLIASGALETARDLEPGNRLYSRALSRFRLTDRGSGHSGGRPIWCNADLGEYAKEPDIGTRVEQMLDAAWICWLDFDGYQNRAITDGPSGPTSICLVVPLCENDLVHVSSIMEKAIGLVVRSIRPLEFEVAGEMDYLRMTSLLREAYRLEPGNERAYHYLSMSLATLDSWTELAELARERTRRVPDDGWGWMTLAMATYRMQPAKSARAMFDSAFARLDPQQRARLDRFERVMRPGEAVVFLKQDAAVRADISRRMWKLAEPLWSAPQADPYTEFLARVTYAELRWTVDEQHVRGADSDRGDIYIRYGPPDRVLGGTDRRYPGRMFTSWVYNAGLVFLFDKRLSFGTAKFPGADLALVEKAKDWQPARWDNIAATRIDSMPTQLARFRAGRDSVDVYLATRAPLEAMQLTALRNVTPLANFWLYALTSPAAFVDSTGIGESGVLTWTRRVSEGAYYFRVESIISGTLIAGRTAGGVTMGADSASGFAMRGFGISDLLLVTDAKPATSPKRWSDIEFTPLLGDVARGAELSLVWEIYEAGRRGDNANYGITVTLERASAKSGRIAAQIVSRIAGAIGVDASEDKLAMRFDRTAPHAATIADNIAINLGTTPPGNYRLTLAVLDRVSGRVTSRTAGLVIRE